MSHLQSGEKKQLPRIVTEYQTSNSTNNHEDDDDAFIKNETIDDQQAQIRRRAPTRHSIKSLTGRKTLSRQTSTTEVK